jgi:hypothetical protein
MAIETLTEIEITVEADIEEAWNSASSRTSEIETSGLG